MGLSTGSEAIATKPLYTLAVAQVPKFPAPIEREFGNSTAPAEVAV